jgi:hypothetical protein
MDDQQNRGSIKSKAGYILLLLYILVVLKDEQKLNFIIDIFDTLTG